MLNKNFYITIVSGLILVIVNLFTLGFFGIYVLILPIDYLLIYIFGFPNTGGGWIGALTGCSGEDCWGVMAIAGSLLIFAIFILLSFYIGRKSSLGEFNWSHFFKKSLKIIIPLLAVVFIFIVFLWVREQLRPYPEGNLCNPYYREPLEKFIQDLFKECR